MIKKILFIFMLFSTFFLYSTEYKLTISNDLYGMNLFNPIDDARTVSFLSKTPLIGKLFVGFEYSALTDRKLDTRIDEAIIYMSYTFVLQKLYLTPQLGTMISGDLGGSNIQNTLHKSIGIYTVDSIYDKKDANIILYTSLYSIYKHDLYADTDSSMNIKVEPLFSTVIVPTYLLSFHLGAGLSLYAKNFKGTLSYKYGTLFNLSGINTLDKITSIEDQGQILLGLETGLFHYDLTLFPNGQFASGAFSINLTRENSKANFNEIDLKLSPGAEININNPVYQRSLTLSSAPLKGELSRIDFLIKSSYGWRSPVLKANSSSNPLYYHGTHFNKFVFGTNINLLTSARQRIINPYIGIGIGIESYHYFQEFNTNEYNNIPVYELIAGLQILIPQFLVKDNVMYGLTLAAVRRDSLNNTEFKDKIFVNAGLTVAVDF